MGTLVVSTSFLLGKMGPLASEEATELADVAAKGAVGYKLCFEEAKALKLQIKDLLAQLAAKDEANRILKDELAKSDRLRIQDVSDDELDSGLQARTGEAGDHVDVNPTAVETTEPVEPRSAQRSRKRRSPSSPGRTDPEVSGGHELKIAHKRLRIEPRQTAPRADKKPDLDLVHLANAQNGEEVEEKPASSSLSEASCSVPEQQKTVEYVTSAIEKLRENPVVGKPRGLLTTGATCYANAGLQVLARTVNVALLFELLGHDHVGEPHADNFKQYGWHNMGKAGMEPLRNYIQNIAASKDLNLCRELLGVLEDMQNTKRSDSVNPFPYQFILGKIVDEIFNGTKQQDSAEHFRAAIQCLAKGHTFMREFAVFHDVHPLVSALFRACNEYTYQCSNELCGHTKIQSDQDWNVTLHSKFVNILPKTTDNTTLTGLLDILHQPEDMDGTCDMCGGRGARRQWVGLRNCPEFLTFQFNRATMDYSSKLGYHVALELELDFSQYDRDGLNTKYELMSVVQHGGETFGSGHYYAIVKTSDERWWECNDEKVNQIYRYTLDSKLHRDQAYQAVYRKVVDVDYEEL